MAEPTYLSDLYHEEVYAIGSKVLIVLEKDWATVTEEERNLLDKILLSVKRSRAGVRIIARRSFLLTDLAVYRPSHVIAFGARLQGRNTLYEVIQDGAVRLIQADDLKTLDDKKKKALWQGLQQMFDLKA